MAAVAHNWVNGISAVDGSVSSTQPAISDLQNIAANSVLGNNTGGSAPVIALTQAQHTAMINLVTASLSGALPAWPNDATKFFDGAGAYIAVPFTSLSGSLAQTQAPRGGSPGQFWQTNGSGTGTWASHKSLIGWASVNTVNGAGATGFFTNNPCQSIEANCAVPVPFAGTAKRISVTSQSAAGAGNTYTITLRLNAADTALTCTISGASQTSCQSTGTASIADDQMVDFKVVASASAAAMGFSGSIEIDTP